jgi:hypothetical protein
MSSDVFWWHSSENLSPKVSPAFLERQRRILVPAQYAREHQNSWVDAADGFTSAAEVDAAMSHGWVEQIDGRPGTDYIGFVDLGATHDPSVIAVGHVEGDLAYIDVLRTFQGSREQPVQIVVVEETLRDLAQRFNVTRIRVESWQGLSAVQSLQRAGLPVELFAPTAKAHADEWPVLAQRLASRTLVLFPHARLREELLGLVVELGAAGVRVIDRGQVHQDHAVAVRGVVAAFARRVDGFAGYMDLSDRERERIRLDAETRWQSHAAPGDGLVATTPAAEVLDNGAIEAEWRERRLAALERMERRVLTARRGAW